MKACTVSSYGDPEKVIKLEERSEPNPEKDQILIRVKAATINDYDLTATTGDPKSYRLIYGLTKPRARFQQLGMEVSGTVEQVGPEATRFKPGDNVFGDTSAYGLGTLAECVVISEKHLKPKPDSMPFEDAAAIPHASLLAYQGLLLGGIQKGMNILINGAGGGVGTFALQIAKQYEATVTGVDCAQKLEMLERLGCDHVLDYQKEDLTKNGKKYDLIIDPRTSRSPFSFLKSLTKTGRYVTVGGETSKLLQLFIAYPIARFFTEKRLILLGLEPNKGLEQIVEWYLKGIIKPVIDGPHPFEKVPEMITLFGTAKHKGKIVIRINE